MDLAHSQSTENRYIAAGVLLAGVLMGCVGPLMVLWRYQLDRDPQGIGLHFFALDATLLTGALLSRWIAPRVNVTKLVVAAGILAAAAFVGLGFAAPPVRSIFRVGGICILGGSAGILLFCTIHLLKSQFEYRPASAVKRSGLFFGLGCVLSAAVLALTYEWTTVFIQSCILGGIALIAAVTPLLLPAPASPQPGPEPGPFAGKRAALGRALSGSASSSGGVSNLAVALFSLLLFFQFGNEWALTTWLPLLLVRRLGVSPADAFWTLALYFTALLLGRILTQFLRSIVGHTQILFGSILLSMLSYLLLSFTDTAIGASLAAMVAGLSFAPIYGLVAERIGRRFELNPQFFTKIFTFAVAGGIFMPWLLGIVGHVLGMQYLLLVTALGSAAVLVLYLLILLESTLMSPKPDLLSKAPAAVPRPHPYPSSKSMTAKAGDHT